MPRRMPRRESVHDSAPLDDVRTRAPRSRPDEVARDEAEHPEIAAAQVLGVEEALAARVPHVEALEVVRAAPVVVLDDERRLVPQRAAAPSASGSRTRCPRPPPRARSARRSRRAASTASRGSTMLFPNSQPPRRSPLRSRGDGSSFVDGTARGSPTGSTRPVTIAPGCAAASRPPVADPVRRDGAVVVGHEHDVVRRGSQPVVSSARDADDRRSARRRSAARRRARRRQPAIAGSWLWSTTRISAGARVARARATRGSGEAARGGRSSGSTTVTGTASADSASSRDPRAGPPSATGGCTMRSRSSASAGSSARGHTRKRSTSCSRNES